VGAGIANFLGGTTIVSGSELDHGQARGGKGNSASGTGALFAGLGAGGGIFNFLGNYNSSSLGLLNPSVVTVTNSTLDHNLAQGGGGGNGLGGGAYNDATSTLKLTKSLVIGNHANGKPGVGGGIYNLGTFTFDVFTVIAFNHASTSGDNVGP
jgi:hypothetical protein